MPSLITRDDIGTLHPVGTTVSVSFSDAGTVIGYFLDEKDGWKLVVHLDTPAKTEQGLVVHQCIVHHSNITHVYRQPVVHRV